jgi:hypothetical protein
MTQDEISRTADAWILYWLERGSATRESSQWAFKRYRDLPDSDPDAFWQLILTVHRKDQSPAIQEVLSAGPLEDLLARHGQDFIALVELEAAADPSFAHLLGGVWKSGMSDDVWAWVQAVWNRKSWDGIPE